MKNKVPHCQPLNKSKFSFQWQRCSALAEHCRLSCSIAGAATRRDSPIQMSARDPPAAARPASATSWTLKMSHATQRNQFRICIHCPDTTLNRFIGLMRFTLSFNLLPHSSVLFMDEFSRLYCSCVYSINPYRRFPISSKRK